MERTLQTTKNVLKSKRNERVIKGNLGQCLFYSEKRYKHYMNKKSKSLLIKKILMNFSQLLISYKKGHDSLFLTKGSLHVQIIIFM